MNIRAVPLTAALVAIFGAAQMLSAQDAVIPRTFETRETYVAYKTKTALQIDGVLNEPAWKAASWTHDFVDIEGKVKPAPAQRTRVKMLWDADYLYIAAQLDERDVWGTITKRDAVIFHDNDFEVFIDPDGDTHNYYELEINALNTVWDLMLTMPYRDGGRALDTWNIDGLKSAVRVDGTLNHTGDADRGWAVELAMPWRVLQQHAPSRRAPRGGEQWRINFSRVEWDADTVAGRYVKRTGANGKPVPEHNWVWSPQGAINMHMPERWGTVQFSSLVAGGGTVSVRPDNDELARAALRSLYYEQRMVKERTGHYSMRMADLRNTIDAAEVRPTPEGYEITARLDDGGVLHIDQHGRIWRTK